MKVLILLPLTDLSCLCLVARALCSSSMMQLGGSCGCRVPRCGEPVGVDILALSREPCGSLGSVKFLGKVAGDFFTGTAGAPVKGGVINVRLHTAARKKNHNISLH